MGEVLLGAIALILIVFLLRTFVGANPKALAKVLRYAGAVALGGLAIGLFVMERPAAGAFVASIAWGVFTGGHAWPGGWPHWNRRSAPSQGRASSVRTAWLEMELDHDSGDMRGTILQGEYAGQRLDHLDRNGLMAFYAQVASDDIETKRLLEAYLDRTLGPDWHAGERAAAGTRDDRHDAGRGVEGAGPEGRRQRGRDPRGASPVDAAKSPGPRRHGLSRLKDQRSEGFSARRLISATTPGR